MRQRQPNSRARRARSMIGRMEFAAQKRRHMGITPNPRCREQGAFIPRSPRNVDIEMDVDLVAILSQQMKLLVHVSRQTIENLVFSQAVDNDGERVELSSGRKRPSVGFGYARHSFPVIVLRTVENLDGCDLDHRSALDDDRFIELPAFACLDQIAKEKCVVDRVVANLEIAEDVAVQVLKRKGHRHHVPSLSMVRSETAAFHSQRRVSIQVHHPTPAKLVTRVSKPIPHAPSAEMPKQGSSGNCGATSFARAGVEISGSANQEQRCEPAYQASLFT